MRPEEVPAGPLLVDTDVFSFIFSQRGPYVAFEEIVAGHLLAVSFATVGELRAGATKAGWGPRKLKSLEAALGAAVILRSTDAVIDHYSRFHARFTGRLKRGGTNDMWTAACALAQPEPPAIVTNNLSDFQSMASEFPLVLVHPDL